MQPIRTIRGCAAAGALVILALSRVAGAQCVGDCNDDGTVGIGEAVTTVNIALDRADVEVCTAADSDEDGIVHVDEVVEVVGSLIDGCPGDCGDCDDGNVCTSDICDDGSCIHPPVACEDDGEECTSEFCDPVSGCDRVNVDDGTSCNGGAGSCQGGTCVTLECVGDGDCDDGNECTSDSCIDNACVRNAVEDGTLCNGGAGLCQAGVCAPALDIEYEQDFESLDPMSDTALSADGWMVFGNVFNAQTGAYLYGYGAFPAPNGGAAFSAIVTDQGGPEQGDRQLSIYNDYDNQDHAAGRRIESNVFRERRITAADAGKTLTFSFDAKRGNINDPSDPLCPCTTTAFAFIKTLNPAAGFITTNLVDQETTSIPDTWGRFTLTLEIDGSLVNQLLQVGFVTNATLFQPSAVFYDNLQVGSAPTAP